MTNCARGWKAGRAVVGIGGTSVIRFVAGIAVGGGSGEDVVHVARRAGHIHMCSGQRKRRAVVIERRIGPGGGVVARVARRGETRGGMRGIVGTGVLRLVTGITILRQ